MRKNVARFKIILKGCDSVKLYIDFDGTIVDTIMRVCDIYNEDYSFYDNFVPVSPEEIKTWNFDELKLANRKIINQYFTQPRFFNEGLQSQPHAFEVINKLHNDGDSIVVVSSGVAPNLKIKKAWLRNHIEFDDFIGVDLSRHKNKNHIDMKDGIFIDDMTMNLNGSNAIRKICFGEEYDWNSDWKGERCYTWDEIYKLIREKTEEL